MIIKDFEGTAHSKWSIAKESLQNGLFDVKDGRSLGLILRQCLHLKIHTESTTD